MRISPFIKPNRPAATNFGCSFQHCGHRHRRDASSASSCGAPLRKASSSFIFNRKFGSPMRPWSAPRLCCAGDIRNAALLRREPSSTRLRRAPSLRTSDAGSSGRLVNTRRHGAPWASRSRASASQAHDPALTNDVELALRDAGLPAEVLELEITENAAFNFEDPSPPLQKLHELGVKLAFDDFGTGYASLNYLTRFPVSRIKLDRSFIGKITDNGNNATIVSSLIAMAHKLALRVIAEGVETEAQAAFLLKESCEEAQGFLYSKPLPAEEFERYLQSRRLDVLARDQNGEPLGRQESLGPREIDSRRRRTSSRL